MELKAIQELTDQLLDCTHKLVVGPNKYKSQFGRLVEGTFRRDYLTLYTIQHLSKSPLQQQVIFGNSCMDLCRRVFEDLVGLEYIQLNGKEKLTKKFMDFRKVEVMRDINYIKAAGLKIDKETEEKSIRDFDSVKKKFEDKRSKDSVRRAWAGLDVESMIMQLLERGVIKADESLTLLRTYQAGCYKNHFSPSDIFSFLYEDLFELSNINDLTLSLLSTLSSITKMAITFTKEFDVDSETEKGINKIWGTLLNAHLKVT